MTADEYTAVLAQAHVIRRRAMDLAHNGMLDDAISASHHADAVGPILDPTLYQHQEQKMPEDREVLVGVRDLSRLGRAR